ncbi:hypothetical protein EGT74_00455 [Chitinophaga lutea]|uniref:Molecular chaperone n=2 Tax=Chitinophaga lutea TaxID=2488634 RepID=A0A3N4PTA6_9BACT|nr:hypothetical protein EGT74_00455 [Chitinophaga lutea]
MMLARLPAQAQSGLAATPMKLFFDAPPGSPQTLSVALSNPSPRVMEAGISLADWRRDSSGHIVYYPPGSQSNSCAAWLKVLPGERFSLRPGETKQFSVILQAPARADSLKNSMLFFTQLNTDSAKDERGMHILVAVRVGVQVIYTPPGQHKKDIDILAFSDSRDSLRVTLQNTGQLEANGKAACELLHLASGKKNKLKETDFYTLPGARRVLQWALPPGLEKGKYTATVMVDIGPEQELKIGELEFSHD